MAGIINITLLIDVTLGTKGMNSSVIIISGILSKTDNTIQTQNYKIISIEKPKPQSLQQLAMKTVFKHQDRLPWNILPKELIAQIMFPGTGHDHHL